MSSQQDNRSWFGRWARTYDRPYTKFWMRGFQKPVFLQINLDLGGKLLDISCGTGEFLRRLLLDDRKGALQLYGVDLTPEMILAAGKKLPSSVRLSVGDVHFLPFEQETFDYVVSTEAFHHYENQKMAVAEMVRVTKRKGRVIVVDSNFFIKPIHWLFERLEPGCQKINSRKEMKLLFENAGLAEIQQKRSFLFAVMTVGIKK